MSMTYKVRLESRVVKTTVINTVAQLDQSLRGLLVSISQNVRSNNLKCVVGLGVEKEFRPSSTIDGGRAPCCLSIFLQLRGLSFVGVGVEHCLKALERDYGIKCRNAVDLGELTATLKGKEMHRGYGLPDMAKELCFTDMKEHLVNNFTAAALSNWGVATLSQKQVEAATSEAFICFYLGNDLYGGYLGSAF
ncbi:hypothetical protein RDABS01_018162 [Bienertia sinuspersici]